MNIQSIEPTPSPNTMKLTLDQTLPQGKSNNYTLKNKEEAPPFIQKLFEIEGVKGVYHVADFLAIERNAKVDWKVILPKVRAVFGDETGDGPQKEKPEVQEGYGEVQVFLQLFKGIPMQIKLSNGEEEVREGLPERFANAAFAAQQPDDNVVLERKWVEQGVRYGELADVAKDVAEEVSAAFSQERLDRLVNIAKGLVDKTQEQTEERFRKVTLADMEQDDWRDRYAALDKMDPTEEDLPVLEKALQDEKASIRRLATVYLGMIEKPVVLPLLEKALKDPSVTVRRTAGDCMSDIGDPAAIPAMIEALKDKNKLVRWRAAMFLYEVGDETAIDALRLAEDDPEFEVAMQVKMALERIVGGEEAKGSVWKQMTEEMAKGKNE
ncbi:conserved virulence factor C family protein [Halalkalibacterium halodurans]|uniref:BH1718 protein n=2 Tax=Halalkalibacterium halodurans TaxID=86665 RepID=Q9KC56_HALH5|nr:conserved virulence factor C family protein [Halalkalibacterium halodurans]MED4082408.1 conserved virulence factor C family protein [Halalkalibacterium halodurans]MED4083441.1 conserved virulence factor C family protein [Halalkalibacterium halodurans]MED4105754.1 conserved virulence factor C family protein [Halalkalibacterium halodurans]MED4109866.1 conserved virulence factor C family protein [Halalkalibacterium halodurans]MED4149207.1 conserved virulence factor C family protein [Halalkalib